MLAINPDTGLLHRHQGGSNWELNIREESSAIDGFQLLLQEGPDGKNGAGTRSSQRSDHGIDTQTQLVLTLFRIRQVQFQVTANQPGEFIATRIRCHQIGHQLDVTDNAGEEHPTTSQHQSAAVPVMDDLRTLLVRGPILNRC